MNQIQRILAAPSLALDSNLYIHALNNNPDFSTVGQLFQGIKNYSGRVVTSVMSLLEFTVPFYQKGQQQLIQESLSFLSDDGRILIQPVNNAIALKAAELRALYHLKAPDAIHLATAVYSGCQVFISSDQDFQRCKIKGLTIEIIGQKS